MFRHSSISTITIVALLSWLSIFHQSSATPVTSFQSVVQSSGNVKSSNLIKHNAIYNIGSSIPLDVRAMMKEQAVLAKTRRSFAGYPSKKKHAVTVSVYVWNPKYDEKVIRSKAVKKVLKLLKGKGGYDIFLDKVTFKPTKITKKSKNRYLVVVTIQFENPYLNEL